MLSYVHDFHAGNFADVHKHVVLSLVLDYLKKKPTPLALLDLYAGSGSYDLNSAAALKTAEASQGIALKWPLENWPEILKGYAKTLAQDNGLSLSCYPGSPLQIARLSRPQDRLIFNELHPRASAALKTLFHKDSRVHLHQRHAHEALIALVPPVEKRGLVLLDPSYEQKSEYLQLRDALLTAFKRWRQGVYLLWYPLLPANHHRPMIEGLLRSIDCEALVSELRLANMEEGMHGSGMLVLNPTWGLHDALVSLMDWFAGLGGEAQAELSCRIITPNVNSL